MTSKTRYYLQIITMILLIGGTITSVSFAVGSQPFEAIFTTTDIDKNGHISENEWHTAMQKRFEQIDVNGDHQISRSEVQKAKESAIQNWRKNRTSNL